MQKHYSVDRIMGLIPDQILDELALETDVDYSVKKLSGKIVFQLFLYNILSARRTSQRILAAIYSSPRFQALFHTKSDVQFSAISMRLSNIKVIYFQKIFTHLVTRYQKEFISVGKQKLAVKKLDSTFITLSSKLLSIGMNMKDENRYIKFGVIVENNIPVDMEIFTETKDISDNTTFLPHILKHSEKNVDITVFDRGLQKIDHFITLVKEEHLFVSRIRDAQKMILVKEGEAREESSTLTDIRDGTFVFEKDPKTFFRVITAKKKDTGESIRFITNITTLSPVEITEVYRSRWDIEVFFKFIKQEISFSRFLSRNMNGIEAVMYLSMSVAILLMLYKQKNKLTNWVIIKMQFCDELEALIMHTWTTEILSAFQDRYSGEKGCGVLGLGDFER